jgi:hypothetical protein
VKHFLPDHLTLRMSQPCETSGGRVIASTSIVRLRALIPYWPKLRRIIAADCPRMITGAR